MVRQQNKENKKMGIKLLPIICSIGLVPLLVHIYTYKTGLEIFDWYPSNSAMQNDFFLIWKMITIIVLGIIMLIIMAVLRKKEKNAFRFENSFYLLFFYLIFVVMSAIFSSYKRWVFRGTFELMEPVWVLLGYVILCYYTYNIVRNEKQLNLVIKYSGIGVCIALTIGMFQTFGMDFFQSHIGKLLITNPSNWDRVGDMEFSFGKLAYMTLYNPDYIIFYSGIIAPILIALFINTKNKILKLIIGILCIASVISLIGAHTTTGWMAILLTTIVVALILLSRDRKKFIAGSVGIAILLILSLCFVFTSSSTKNIKDVIVGTYKVNKDYGIKSIETNSDVCINYNGENTHFAYDADSELGTLTMYCTDDSGNNLIQTTDSSGKSVFTDSNGTQYIVEAVYIENDLGIRITIDDHQWVFEKLDDGTYYYFNAAGKTVKFSKVNQVEWFNEDAVSGRGHIWNKTIPLLLKHIFIGSGANSYLLEVPQNDYLYKNYTDTNNNFDVKAHSWYLQQWIENGLLATISLIAFYMWYFVSSVKIYRKISFNKDIHRIGFAIFVGLLIYMIAALVNDPTVNVAPIYWAVIGLGFSINRMIMENDPIFKIESNKDSISNQETVVQNTDNNTKSNRNNSKRQSRKARKKQQG